MEVIDIRKTSFEDLRSQGCRDLGPLKGFRDVAIRVCLGLGLVQGRRESNGSSSSTICTMEKTVQGLGSSSFHR